MGRVIILIMILLAGRGKAFPLDERGFVYYDSVTYALYLERSWSELTEQGKEALKKGIDYYYLRMRMGIAAFETENYARAVAHFNRALEFNSADTAASEYLYWSYIYSGRELEAGNFAGGSPATVRRKLSYNTRSTVRSVSLNMTGSYIHDRSVIDEYSAFGDPEFNGSQSVTRKFRLFGASLEHEAGSSVLLMHSLGYLAKNYLFWSRENTESEFFEDARHTQFQYYLSGKILIGEGLLLVPSLHYLNVRIPAYTVIAGRGGRSMLVEQYLHRHDFAFDLALERNFGLIKTGISAGYTYINERQHAQGSFLLGLFPMGNLNLYSVSEITRYYDMDSVSEGGRWVLSQVAGMRVLPQLWLEVGGTMGDMSNYAGTGAYYVYNDTAVTKGRYGVSAISPLFDRGIELSLHYSLVMKESSIVISPGEFDTGINTIEARYHQITGGITWKF